MFFLTLKIIHLVYGVHGPVAQKTVALAEELDEETVLPVLVVENLRKLKNVTRDIVFNGQVY